MEKIPLVSIIIPHYLGDVLSDCLDHLYTKTHGTTFEVIVVDDQPYDDGSLVRAQCRFPNIRIVKTGSGNGNPSRGFGSGCNRGLKVARGRYVMLLNNDVEVSEGWLLRLLEIAESDNQIGVCQPKVLSLHNPDQFDYGGAAGGLIDLLGFTFCRGRIFNTVEKDHGQYDRPQDIFWAIGGAMFIRKSCLEKSGIMDENFLMHMEEIDLCWRIHLVGFRIVSVPRSVVYHYGGWSLKSESFKKAYFNHRNQLIMILKNWSFPYLVWIFPLRVLMMTMTVIPAISRGDWKNLMAVLKGLLWINTHPLNIWRRRQKAQQVRTVPDNLVMKKMYKRSVVFDYFVVGIRKASELPGVNSSGALPSRADE